MAQVYNRLTLDAKKKNHDIITAVQKDTASRFLDINLVDNGVNINLSGHRVRIYARKPDGTEVYNDGQITNASQGRVQIELTSQLLAKEGYIEAQIITYRNNQQILSTLPFKIFVVSSLMSDSSVESSNEYGALVILYQNLYEAMDQMTTMVQRIGTPGTVAQQNNLDTMFEVWEWMITYMKENGTAGLIDKINSIKNNTDLLTNSTYGLNALLTTLKHDISKFSMLSKRVKISTTTHNITSSGAPYTLVNIIGEGIATGIYFAYPNYGGLMVEMIVDDIVVLNVNTSTSELNQSYIRYPIYYKKNLKVVLKNSVGNGGSFKTSTTYYS